MKRSSRYSRWSAKEKRQRRRARLWWRWRLQYEREMADAALFDLMAMESTWAPADPEDDFFDRVLL